MTVTTIQARGATWLRHLTGGAPSVSGYCASLDVIDADILGRPARFIAVLPDERHPFPRARNGEVGLLEGWNLARAVHDVSGKDSGSTVKSAIVAVIDVPSQAYGRSEEALGIHQALAGAVDAYASARLAGHPVIGLMVGKAMSGAFLAHGSQANRLIALNDPQVQVHAMGKQSAARVTQRSVEAVEALAVRFPPMAYDINSYASLGLPWRCLSLINADQPDAADVALVMQSLHDAVADIDSDPDRGLPARMDSEHRHATRIVRTMLREQWANS